MEIDAIFFRMHTCAAMPNGLYNGLEQIGELVADFRANGKFFFPQQYQERGAQSHFTYKVWVVPGWSLMVRRMELMSAASEQLSIEQNSIEKDYCANHCDGLDCWIDSSYCGLCIFTPARI